MEKKTVHRGNAGFCELKNRVKRDTESANQEKDGKVRWTERWKASRSKAGCGREVNRHERDKGC